MKVMNVIKHVIVVAVSDSLDKQLNLQLIENVRVISITKAKIKLIFLYKL